MRSSELRRGLRALITGPDAARGTMAVQHLGFTADQMDWLGAVVRAVSRRIDLALELDGLGGHVVLIAEEFADRVAPQVLQAFLEDRPVVTLEGPGHSANLQQAAGNVEVTANGVLEQLASVAGKGGRRSLPHAMFNWAASPAPEAAHAGFDSSFDSRLNAAQLDAPELDPERARLIARLRQGMLDPGAPGLSVSYGPEASMRFDFATGVVTVDELALQRLRVMRELPRQVQDQEPLDGAAGRDLDLVMWDLGVACGAFRLLDSPQDWWHASLVSPSAVRVQRYTRNPRHLDMARKLVASPVSPAQLRRLARVGLGELRGFLQACLYLGLTYWCGNAKA